MVTYLTNEVKVIEGSFPQGNEEHTTHGCLPWLQVASYWGDV